MMRRLLTAVCLMATAFIVISSNADAGSFGSSPASRPSTPAPAPAPRPSTPAPTPAPRPSTPAPSSSSSSGAKSQSGSKSTSGSGAKQTGGSPSKQSKGTKSQLSTGPRDQRAGIENKIPTSRPANLPSSEGKGRNYAADAQRLKRESYRLDPYDRHYFGNPASPFYYIYLGMLLDGDDSNNPIPAQYSEEYDGEELGSANEVAYEEGYDDGLTDAEDMAPASVSSDDNGISAWWLLTLIPAFFVGWAMRALFEL